MRWCCAGSIVSLLWCTPGALPGQSLPSGWRLRGADASDSARTFEATGLPAGQFVRVTESPLLTINATSLERWATAAALADSAPAGTWSAAGVTPISRAPTIAVISRLFGTDTGRASVAIYAAVSGNARLGRVLRVAFSPAELASGPQGVAARTLMSDLAAAEIRASRSKVPRTAAAASFGSAISTTDVTAPTEGTGARDAAPSSLPPVAPGAGLRSEQIETVFYHWNQRYDAFQGLVMDEAVYLLLKDGTVYDRLPSAFEQVDLASLRRSEPQNWGRWRKQGAGYEFSWRSDNGRWRTSRGNPLAASKPDARLEGRFTAASSYQLPGGGVSMTLQTELTLSANGRFSLDGESSGTYRIDGYGIELRHTNGRVERRAFVIDGDGIIWGQGRLVRVRK